MSHYFLRQHTVTFFGLLRVSEVLALQANHISQNQLGQFFITISSSKTDQKGRSSVVQIQQLPQTHFCPSSTITPFLQARPPRKPTLFVHIDGSPVTRSQFQAVLDKSLSFLQVKGHYKSHSFRIGMAMNWQIGVFLMKFKNWGDGDLIPFLLTSAHITCIRFSSYFPNLSSTTVFLTTLLTHTQHIHQEDSTLILTKPF